MQLLLERLKLELPAQPPPKIIGPKPSGDSGSVVKTWKTEPLICKHLRNATPSNPPSRANPNCGRVHFQQKQDTYSMLTLTVIAKGVSPGCGAGSRGKAALARAHSTAAFRPRPFNAKRHGARRESAAFAVKQAISPNLKNLFHLNVSTRAVGQLAFLARRPCGDTSFLPLTVCAYVLTCPA